VTRVAGDHERKSETRPSAVRPFLLTGGRVVAATDLPLEAQVVTREIDGSWRQLSFERRDIASLCRAPISVAEVAATLGLQVGTVRVLVSELHAAGHLAVHGASTEASRDPQILERVLRGLRAIS